MKGMKVCVFSTWKHKDTSEGISLAAAVSQGIVRTQRSNTYHSQDGTEDDVQLYDGGVCVVQNGPSQFKHVVFTGQVQVLQNVVVTAHFLRGRPVYCTLK